jgi:hypothetical protein
MVVPAEPLPPCRVKNSGRVGVRYGMMKWIIRQAKAEQGKLIGNYQIEVETWEELDA